MKFNTENAIYETEEEAKRAYDADLDFHRKAIKEAFELYGKDFCRITNADYHELEKRIEIHDTSMIEKEEEYKGFFAKFYPYKTNNTPIHMIKFAYDKARLSHYHNNSDHPEYWVYIENNTLKAAEMDSVSICEMILDWIAISKKEGMLPTGEYWVYNRNTRLIHDNSIKVIDTLIDFFNEL